MMIKRKIYFCTYADSKKYDISAKHLIKMTKKLTLAKLSPKVMTSFSKTEILASSFPRITRIKRPPGRKRVRKMAI